MNRLWVRSNLLGKKINVTCFVEFFTLLKNMTNPSCIISKLSFLWNKLREMGITKNMDLQIGDPSQILCLFSFCEPSMCSYCWIPVLQLSFISSSAFCSGGLLQPKRILNIAWGNLNLMLLHSLWNCLWKTKLYFDFYKITFAAVC